VTAAMSAPDKKRDLSDEQKAADKRFALAFQEKVWTDQVHGSRYETKSGVGLGQIVYDRKAVPSAEWAAYDLQQTDPETNGALLIGHFQGEKQAKQAVEDYWSTIQ